LGSSTLSSSVGLAVPFPSASIPSSAANQLGESLPGPGRGMPPATSASHKTTHGLSSLSPEALQKFSMASLVDPPTAPLHIPLSPRGPVERCARSDNGVPPSTSALNSSSPGRGTPSSRLPQSSLCNTKEHVLQLIKASIAASLSSSMQSLSLRSAQLGATLRGTHHRSSLACHPPHGVSFEDKLVRPSRFFSDAVVPPSERVGWLALHGASLENE
jgi:hypothetical protein